MLYKRKMTKKRQYTVTEYAAKMGVSRQHINKLIKDGKLPLKVRKYGMNYIITGNVEEEPA